MVPLSPPRCLRPGLRIALACSLALLPAVSAAPPDQRRPKKGGTETTKTEVTPREKPKPEPTPAAPTPTPTPTPPVGGATSTITAEEVQGFDTQPEPVRRLLAAALELTRRNLTYAYGSADPSAGGMDCSGTIYYLLKSNGSSDVPRQANEQYAWVRKSGRFQAVLSRRAESFELDNLHPGDLLFWTGTYKVDRDPPVTHTMIYLGRRKRDNKPLMVGASDGRPYDGQRRNGVSVFDFRLPAARSGDTTDMNTTTAPDRAPNFAGYGPIPGMDGRGERLPAPTPKTEATASPTPEPTPVESPAKTGKRRRRGE